MNFKSSILQHFSSDPSNWSGVSFRKQLSDIADSMISGEMIAVVGDPGCGKKTIVNHIAKSCANHNKTSMDKHHVVYVQSMDKERIRVGQIANAMIYDLSDETPRRDPEARTRQLAKILGRIVISNREKVTVVIEQAHRLHANTIRAIKELRELKFLGYMDLFGVVMIGHRPLKAKIESLEDVVLRCEMQILDEAHGWMTGNDRLEYLKDRWGNLLTASMRKQIAIKHKTPLAMDRAIYDTMKAVYIRGDHEFKELDFMLDLKEVVQQSGISYQIIADSTPSKLSKATIAQVVNKQYNGKENITREVQETIARLTDGQRDFREAV